MAKLNHNRLAVRRTLMVVHVGLTVLLVSSCAKVSEISLSDTASDTRVSEEEEWLADIEALWAAQECPERYDWEPLGIFNTDASHPQETEQQQAFDIDETGRVCGAVKVDLQVDTEGQFGFYYDGTVLAKFTDVYDLSGELDGVEQVAGCNDSGEFVGRGEKLGTIGMFYVSDTAGPLFPYPPGPMVWARGISPNGLVIGQRESMPSADIEYASGFVWDPKAGWLKEIGQAPGAFGTAGSDALGINDAGVVAGWADDFNLARRPIRWSEDGGMINLPTLEGGLGGRAHAVNNSDMIAGVSNKPQFDVDDALEHPVVWDAENHLYDLGVIVADGQYDAGVALALNDGGIVVGYAYSSLLTHIPQRAFIWCGGEMRDLNTLINSFDSHHALRAIGLNNSGEIVIEASQSPAPDQVLVYKLTPAAGE